MRVDDDESGVVHRHYNALDKLILTAVIFVVVAVIVSIGGCRE